MRSQYRGTWLISEMESWDADFINLVGQGYLTVGRNNSGFMQFGAVELDLDWRVEDAGGIERLEFTMQGFDEGDPVSGRGWATVCDLKMTGRIYLHKGEESGFTAIREKKRRTATCPQTKVISLPERISSADQCLEPRVYVVEVLFKQQKPPLMQFACDLNIGPELAPEIEEDSWGTRGSLEIWFMEIQGRKLTLSIQRAHFKRKETYLRDLKSFLHDMESLSYVERVQIDKH
ncbi:MAG: hypothetical protein JW720_14325 [Sedimentisphaerales bacterium]|nr:hypothetical protein [Sedimentisphaerales bacterium]